MAVHRKKPVEKDKKVQQSILLPSKLKAKYKEWCEKHVISMSENIECLIEAEMEANP